MTDVTRAELEAKLAEHGVTLGKSTNNNDWFTLFFQGGEIYGAHIYLGNKAYRFGELSSSCRSIEGVVKKELSRRQRIVEQAAAAEMRKSLMFLVTHYTDTQQSRDDFVVAAKRTAFEAIARATYTPERWVELQEGKI